MRSRNIITCFAENNKDIDYDWYQDNDDLQDTVERKGTYDFQYQLPAAYFSAQNQPQSKSYNYSHPTVRDLSNGLAKIPGLVPNLRADPSIYYVTDNTPEYSAHNYAGVVKDDNSLRNQYVEDLPTNQIKERQFGPVANNLPVSN